MSNTIPFPGAPATTQLPATTVSDPDLARLAALRARLAAAVLCPAQPAQQLHLIITREEAFSLLGMLTCLGVPEASMPENVLYIHGHN